MKKKHILLLVLNFIINYSFAINSQDVLVPNPPNLKVKSFILIDANSNKIIAQKNPNKEFEPASLTKLMSMYVVSNAIKNKQINLDDQISISTHAWKQQGSRMFVKAGSKVSAKDLIHGVIVASGNDATMALAEYTAGSENSFVDLMNSFAKSLNLQHTNFVNPTGMPAKNHFASAKDLATIARHIINEFPNHYEWYKQKWFTYNKIKQPNRNRLLWSDPAVDGMKTGHTNSAGYCLIASAKHDDMRLIAVVMGAQSDTERNNAASQLLNYGFRFYTTKKVFSKKQELGKITTWKGSKSTVKFGVANDVYVTYVTSANKNISTKTNLPKSINAPVYTEQNIGSIDILIDNIVLTKIPLISLEEISKGSNLKIIADSIKSWIFG
jgi:D-alanyl-D-alanine carboxypeptidase (penicillin-binding protein 5/6)